MGPDDFSGNGVLKRNRFLAILAHIGVGSEGNHLLLFRIVDPDGGRLGLQKLDHVLGHGPEDIPLRVKRIDLEDRLDLADQMVHVLVEDLVPDDVNDRSSPLREKGHIPSPSDCLMMDSIKLSINLEVGHR